MNKPRKHKNYQPSDLKEKTLAKSFSSLKNTQEALNFLRDLLTPAEITEFSNRLEMARLLERGELSYAAIAKKTGASTATVTRVALWLNNGCGGYKSVLQKLKKSG